jgi:gluconate 2-dehydrogenase gamma chain
MAGSSQSRRDFIATLGASGAAWLALQAPLLASLGACARDAAQRGESFTFLTAEQGRAMAAVADRIIPAVDGLPGAKEAGAVHFVDLALGGPLADAKPLIVEGLADLDKRALALGGRAQSFAELAPDAQDEQLRAVEKTPFFGAAYTLVVMGTLSDPKYGGNRDGAGWRLVQLKHAARWEPPFGYYDAEWMREHHGDVA